LAPEAALVLWNEWDWGQPVSFVASQQLSRTLKWMEVHFAPEQQARLAQIATKAGTAPERLVVISSRNGKNGKE
jgi:hypothetical protein